MSARTNQPATTAPRRAGLRVWARMLWVPALLVLASLGVAGTVTILHTEALSPVDEWVYMDYLYKLPSEGLVNQGEPIGEEALDIMACDGVKPYGPMGAPCGGDYSDVSRFPFGGITSADAYTPIYFAITRVAGDAIHWVTGIDLVTSWRLTGSLWLAGGMLVFYGLLRQWNVRPINILGLGLAFIASPFAWWTYTYVSTDAPSFLLGAALLYFAVRYVRGQSSGWWLPALSLLAVLVKVTNILAVCLVALYLLAQWIAEFRRSEWAGWRTLRDLEVKRHSLALVGFAALSVAVATAGQIGWLAIRRALAVGVPADQSIGVYLGGTELTSQLANFLPGTILSNVNISGSTGVAYTIPGYIVAPLSWICVAGVIGAFWSLRKNTTTAPIVVAVAIAAALFAPMLAIVIQVTTGAYFPLPPRYGASVLAGFLLLAGISIHNRWASWALLGYGTALTTYVVLAAPLYA